MTRNEAQQKNHPKKGDMITVEPIRSKNDLNKVKLMLADKNSPFDLTLFITGINTNLRASDLLKLKIGDIITVVDGWNVEPLLTKDVIFKVKQEVLIKEKKTQKRRVLQFNKVTRHQIASLIRWGWKGKEPYSFSDYLFKSYRGSMLKTSSLSKKVKAWCADAGLKGNYSSHSLRKTWAYFQFNEYKVPMYLISKAMNHSNEAVTYRYIGLQDEQISDIFRNEI